MIPESQDSKALGFQPEISFSIRFDLGGMLPAVALNDEFDFVADEVDDVRTDGGLPSEFKPVQLSGTQGSPQTSFGIGRVLYAPNQIYLLPPNMAEWLPEGHLALFIHDVVDQLNLKKIYADYEKGEDRGQPPYHPAMMLKLLVYAYCTGKPSSRKIERATWEDVAYRVLSADQHPDHDSVAEFRKRHLKVLSGLFLQVLKLCQKAGLVKRVKENAKKLPEAVSADAGYFSEANVTAKGLKDVDLYIPPDRQKHGEKPAAVHGRPPKNLSVADRMRRKLRTKAGQGVYRFRKAIVEPVFGQIKEARNFRRFSLRGLTKVEAEWTLVCLTHNLLKLFRSGWVPQAA